MLKAVLGHMHLLFTDGLLDREGNRLSIFELKMNCENRDVAEYIIGTFDMRR